MDDFISRETAIALIDQHCFESCYDAEWMEEALKDIPAADVRPVVLCKDCRHRDPEDNKCDCGQLERAGCVFPVDDNYWCAHGEKGETNAKD